jgi:hypothetical protein
LSDSVVNSHEVGVFRELGDDFTRTYPLSPTSGTIRGWCAPSWRLDRVPLRDSVRERFSEASAPFVALPIALTSGILDVVGFIGMCIGRQLVCGYVFGVAIGPGT